MLKKYKVLKKRLTRSKDDAIIKTGAIKKWNVRRNFKIF